MISDSRKRKLEFLARAVARGDLASAEELLLKRGHSGVNRGREAGRPVPPGARVGEGAEALPKVVPLAQVCVCGAEARIVTPAGEGVYWLVRRGGADVAEQCGRIASEYAAVLKGARQRFDELEASKGLCQVADAAPGDLLFVDTETCGFSGTTIFLVGMMFHEDGRLVFEQCLARDYSEEGAVLQAFASRQEAAGVLVSFNGKAFDMSMIRDRCAFHGIQTPPRTMPHLDLLHEVRRRWRKDLPNCKLQTLERYFCGRRRTGDIPSSAIPEAYHRFVATGDAAPLGEILHHNLLDLLTMAQLVVALLTGCGPATEA
jgi:uncharacterized protein YprB with RNaseH-like and TPR domain